MIAVTVKSTIAPIVVHSIRWRRGAATSIVSWVRAMLPVMIALMTAVTIATCVELIVVVVIVVIIVVVGRVPISGMLFHSLFSFVAFVFLRYGIGGDEEHTQQE